MIKISEIISSYQKPEKIKIMPKKWVISLISQQVKFSPDSLTNWKIVARRLAPASVIDTSKIYYSIQKGTYLDSTDIKGAFLYMCKKLPVIKKPKQSKLFK